MIKQKGAETVSKDELLAFLKAIEIIADKSESIEEFKKALGEIQSPLKAR